MISMKCVALGCDGLQSEDDQLCGECRAHEEKVSAWDCDPDAVILDEPYDLDLDEEDDEGDWQVLALDRWGDREMVGYANMRF